MIAFETEDKRDHMTQKLRYVGQRRTFNNDQSPNRKVNSKKQCKPENLRPYLCTSNEQKTNMLHSSKRQIDTMKSL